MFSSCRVYILCFIFIEITGAATVLQDCMDGGYWTEWNLTQPCNFRCGYCGVEKYARTCLTKGCACTGSPTKTVRCIQPGTLLGVQGCVANEHEDFCCEPYIKMLAVSQKAYVCATYREANMNQCPKYGVWGPWNETCTATCGMCGLPIRNRTCISDSYGCPCSLRNPLQLADRCGSPACKIDASIKLDTTTLSIQADTYCCKPYVPVFSAATSAYECLLLDATTPAKA
ncbi:unnamed protein product, partial [Mesorhabditis spiculigera]